LLDALHERFPALEIESCAGGGGRVDLGILERTQRVWASDCIDAHDRQNIQRGTTLLLPPELVGTHVGAGRAHTTLRELDLDFRAGTALWGHMGVEWDLAAADAAARERLAAVIALYKELRPLLHTGLTVHADLAQDEALRIEGVVAPDGTDALFQIACLGQLDAWPTAPRPLPGLDPDRRYHVRLAAPAYPELRLTTPWMEDDGVVLPGSYLVSTGLALPVLHPDHLILVRATALD
ncbi:MAG: alpha-galactosidase, partial [Actinomyces sp.]|uniref:alpha-galactosidase n=1 Tax=Actinomyces sp. TaxID=29317 RepID=UPI0026DC3E76